MTQRVIIDTGPLVAFLDRRERYHSWISRTSPSMPIPWLTCESVLAETYYLLRRVPVAQDALLVLIQKGILHIDFSIAEQVRRIRNLLRAYRDVPMSLADACLVRLAQENPDHAVCTLDSDFRVYRAGRNKSIPLIMPTE